jgi:hypothetical protein
MKSFVSIREYARMINTSPRSVSDAIKAGKINKGIVIETIQVIRIIPEIATTEYGVIKQRPILNNPVPPANSMSLRAFAPTIGVSEKTVRKAIKANRIVNGVVYFQRIVRGEIKQVPRILPEVAIKELGNLSKALTEPGCFKRLNNSKICFEHTTF